jgi:uncharacterized protein
MQYRTIHFNDPAEDPRESVAAVDSLLLSEEEVRVAGCLVEKETTTPDYYPLTLNALLSACNQKSSREPVVAYSEQTVREALESLREKGLVHVVTTSDGRVPRYRHVFVEALRLTRTQAAALCVLMLRGPQTPGEIRQRTGRLYEFASLEEVEETLRELMNREPQTLAVRLERQAGTKESRYAHLLAGEVSGAAAPGALDAPTDRATPSAGERIQTLQEDVASLREHIGELQGQIGDLQTQFAEFRKQFE